MRGNYKKNILIPSLFLLLLFFISLSEVHPQVFQTQQPQPQEQHETVVTLKLVQVFVSDSQGNPVLDLTKSDFDIYEDGVLKTITDFEKHLLAEKTSKASQTESSTSSPRMNRKFFIFFDIFGNDIIGMSQARSAALHFIDTQLRPGDEVAVVTYQHMSGFNVKKYLTKDHEKIRKAIKDAREIIL